MWFLYLKKGLMFCHILKRVWLHVRKTWLSFEKYIFIEKMFFNLYSFEVQFQVFSSPDLPFHIFYCVALYSCPESFDLIPLLVPLVFCCFSFFFPPSHFMVCVIFISSEFHCFIFLCQQILLFSITLLCDSLTKLTSFTSH